MEPTLFDLVCSRLGLDPVDVLSIRLNARTVVATTRDPSLILVSKTFVESG